MFVFVFLFPFGKFQKFVDSFLLFFTFFFAAAAAAAVPVLLS